MEPNPDGNVQGGDPGEGDAPGQNPAWNDVLSVIPEQLHSQVTPYFQQWDQSVQQKIEQANSKVKQFEPYQQFAEHDIDPGELEQGLRLMYEINQNPKAVYDALAEAYNLGNPNPSASPQASNTQTQQNVGQGEGEGENAQTFHDPRFDPEKFDNLQEGLNLVAQTVLQEQQAKRDAQADQELETELSTAREKHGEFDEQYVLSMMMHGKTIDEAVEAWQGTVNNLLENNPRPFAPKVMGNSQGGSGLPSQAIDPTKLTPKETRGLVAQMLEAASKQNR